LCTANLCRSPIAEAVFKAQLAQRSLAAQVRSAGFVDSGQPSPPEVAAVLHRWGLTPPDHTSRVVSARDFAAADLVLCMERAHVREAVVLDASIWPKTFTLKELVRRASTSTPRAVTETGAAWLTRIHADRDRNDLLGASLLDDVADPYGKKLHAYETTATELVGLAATLIELMWPSRPRSSD
jgi:protein-tyrosine-phosphatase